ncbi:MAG TPA: type II secretion system protein GspG [Haloferula sp.]
MVEKPATYPADRKWKQVMKELPDDPWDHPYHYFVSPNLDEGYGIYSTGKDGVSHSKGNDLNDWNSWSEDGRGSGTFMQHLGEVPLSLSFGLVALGLAVRAAIRARFVDPLK